MMVAFGSTIIVFNEGMFSLPKSCVDDIVLRSHSVIRGTAVCGKVVPARLSLCFVAFLFFCFFSRYARLGFHPSCGLPFFVASPSCDSLRWILLRVDCPLAALPSTLPKLTP